MRPISKTLATPAVLWGGAIASPPRRLAFLFLLSAATLFAGCATKTDPDEFRPRVRGAARSGVGAATLPAQPAATRPSNVHMFDMFMARADVPTDWIIKRTSGDERHEHYTWVSPTGSTAFGVVFFRLPWPVGHELAFRYGFMAGMKDREGQAEVVEKRWDDEIEGLRFTVNTKRYNIECKFLVRGIRGWATYSGTRRDQPVNEAELEVARRLRETAEFGGETEPKREPAR